MIVLTHTASPLLDGALGYVFVLYVSMFSILPRLCIYHCTRNHLGISVVLLSFSWICSIPLHVVAKRHQRPICINGTQDTKSDSRSSLSSATASCRATAAPFLFGLPSFKI